jgi:hypothetical protein
VGSFGLARFGGLRSSSERERFIGSGWGPVALLLRCLVVDRFGLVVVCFELTGDGGSIVPHDGTGGRFRFGEAIANFLLGCC